MKRWLPLLLAGLSVPAVVLHADRAAAAPSEAELSRARSLGSEGLDALDQHNFELARSRCEEAAQIVDAPALKLCVARALKGLGRMKEAHDVYVEVAGRQLAANAPAPWSEAVQAAAAEQYSIGSDGIAAIAQGHFELANKRCEEAMQIVDTPPLRLCIARSLKGLGRFAAASDAYAELANRKLGPGEPAAWAQAIKAATAEQIKLDPLVATASAETREMLAAGFFALEQRRNEDALKAFDDAGRKERSLAATFGRALALTALGRAKDAAVAFKTFEVAAGADARFADAVARSKQLSFAVLHLVIHECAGLQVSIDGQPARPISASETIKLEPGTHTVRASAPKHVPLSQTVKIVGGNVETIDLALESVPPYRLVGWISLGVGVASLGASAYFTSQAASAHDTLVANCSDTFVCGQPQWAKVNSYDQARTAAFITGGVGAAALITSGVFHVLAPSDEMPSAPTVGLGLGNITVQGAF